MEKKDPKTCKEMAKYIVEKDKIIEKLTERLENYSNNLAEIGMRSQMYCEQQENRAKKAEKEQEILIAKNNRLIKELCGDAEEEVKEKGCEYCNEGHPDYSSISGIHTDGSSHYVEIEVDDGWCEEDGSLWHYEYTNMNYCFNCGRDLSKLVDLSTWGVNNELDGI